MAPVHFPHAVSNWTGLQGNFFGSAAIGDCELYSWGLQVAPSGTSNIVIQAPALSALPVSLCGGEFSRVQKLNISSPTNSGRFTYGSAIAITADVEASAGFS